MSAELRDWIYTTSRDMTENSISVASVFSDLNPEPLLDRGHLGLTRHERLDFDEDSLLRLPDFRVVAAPATYRSGG